MVNKTLNLRGNQTRNQNPLRKLSHSFPDQISLSVVLLKSKISKKYLKQNKMKWNLKSTFNVKCNYGQCFLIPRWWFLPLQQAEIFPRDLTSPTLASAQPLLKSGRHFLLMLRKGVNLDFNTDHITVNVLSDDDDLSKEKQFRKCSDKCMYQVCTKKGLWWVWSYLTRGEGSTWPVWFFFSNFIEK